MSNDRVAAAGRLAPRARIVDALITYVPFLMLFALFVPIIWPREGAGDAFYFWYAGHLVVTGRSPYEPSAWSDLGTFGNAAANAISFCTPITAPSCLWTYPPHTAWVFAPFALFEPGTGLWLLSLFLLLTACASILMLARWMKARSAITRTLAISACVVSEPFVFDVHAGHFDGLGIIGLLLVCGGLNSGRAIPVAAGALLLSVKPHLYVVPAVVVLALVLQQRRWRVLIATTLALAIVGAAGLAREPGALASMVSGATAKAGANIGWASTWAFAGSIVPGSALAGYVIVFGTALASLGLAVWKAPPPRRIDVLVAGSAALSLALPPYLNPYDLMLTFPAFALALALAERLPAPPRFTLQALIALTLAAGTWLAISLSHLQSTVQALPGAVPVLALVYLAVASALVPGGSRPSQASAEMRLTGTSTA